MAFRSNQNIAFACHNSSSAPGPRPHSSLHELQLTDGLHKFGSVTCTFFLYSIPDVDATVALYTELQERPLNTMTGNF